jgi:FkbM family methyltransferase
MKGELLWQAATPIQHAYYAKRVGLGRDAVLLDLPLGEDHDFARRYVLMNEVHRRLHPFHLLRPDDWVVHVGFDRVYLPTGQSHPLVMAALLPNGRVVCVDPDPRNTQALEEYTRAHAISNVTIHNRAVWNKEQELEFVFADGWSPMSVAREVADPVAGEVPRRGTVSRILAAPLRTVVGDEAWDRITVLSLTTNGAEREILEACGDLLERAGLRIHLALAFEHFSYELRRAVCDALRERGFHVGVAHAPHDPWTARPFLFAGATRDASQLHALGFRTATWDDIGRDAVAEAAGYGRLARWSPRRWVTGAWNRLAGRGRLARGASPARSRIDPETPP